MVDLSGRLEGLIHIFPIRVYYEDTDAGNIVYHARYLHFMERARTELLRLLGTPHSQMIADFGTMFALRRSELDFIRPARLDDALEIHSRLIELRGASLVLEQQVMRGVMRGVMRADETLVNAIIRLACITPTGRPARMPDRIVGMLSALLPSSGG
ncbi:MAG: tol-pal system-associated acyl-CoA thioesterase [Rhodospirillaceae bacterium]